MPADYGLLGAIGQGLQSGLGAYNTTNEMALKKRLADIEELKGAGNFYQAVGALPPNVAKHLGYDVSGVNQGQSPSNTVDQLQQSASGPGLVKGIDTSGLLKGSGGMLPHSDNSSGGSASGGTSAPNESDYSPPPPPPGMFAPPGAINARLLPYRQMETTANEKSIPQGKRARWNFRTGQMDYQDITPTGQQAIESNIKQTDLKNKQLEPQLKTQAEYNTESIVKDTKDAAFNFSKMVHAAQEQSPTSDKGIVYNYIRLENPNAVAREGSLEDLRKNPDIYQNYKSIIEAASTGRLDPAVRNDLLRSGASVYQGAREQHKLVQDKYASLAQDRGVNSKFLNEPQLTFADKQAQKVIGGTPQYQPPSFVGDVKKKFGLIGGNNNQSSGKIKVSNGKETRMIDPGDSDAAQKDGYRVVK